jgi:hypothetical protein
LDQSRLRQFKGYQGPLSNEGRGLPANIGIESNLMNQDVFTVLLLPFDRELSKEGCIDGRMGSRLQLK